MERMRRQRKGGGSLWGSKKRSKSLRNKPERGVRELQESKKVVAPADVTDYGQFYDKINAREKCDDLVLLEKVTNEGIVEVLRSRYMSGDMYTSIGPVLIAVNPYEHLTLGGKGIYASGVRDYYHRKGGGDFMAPHIYRVAAETYKSLHADSRDQCVIVTGESGAGKTEAAKQLMHFVTTVGTSSEAQKATMDGVQRHLLDSNPILEAFGNAQTIRNDNSSRFGKYMELQFSYKGVLRGGKVTNYLLEKSRVTGQAEGERCFHVLHYLLEGANALEREEYQLLPESEYLYLMQQRRSIVGLDDGQEFANLKASMSRVKIDTTDQSRLFPLLAGVLSGGNVCFDDHGDGNRASVTQDSADDLTRMATCLGVDAVALEAALTSVTLVVGGSDAAGSAEARRSSFSGGGAGSVSFSGGYGRGNGSGGVGNGIMYGSGSGRAGGTYGSGSGAGRVLRRSGGSWIGSGSSFQRGSTKHTRNLNGGDSSKSRDALAKELYRRLFGWIVEKVNLSIECATKGLTMGILDIYGFEIFDSNDFEQFCINYVNEKLQQYFIDHTIRAEQQDYEEEGVEWEHVDYFNNKTVCDMIEGRHGLLSLLDEVSSYKDNDGAVLVNRYNRAMATHDHYFCGEEAVFGTGYARKRSGLGVKSMSATSSLPHTSTGRQDKRLVDAKKMFGIRHFAGNVTYAAEKFIEKNADRLHRDLTTLLANSSNPLAAELFTEPPAGPHNKARRHPSLSAQFKKQVEALCGSLACCQPHYVRCIKPNSTKAPLEMDDTMIMHQVKYLGLMENVRVRRQGYAYRMPFGHFVRRYGFLSESTWPGRTTKKFWPDGTPYDPAQPSPPKHLIKFDKVEEEFQEMREEISDNNNTDSSDDGATDKETPTPPVQSTPPRSANVSEPTAATNTPALLLQNLTPTKLRAKAAASNILRSPKRQTSKMVMVTSTRTQLVERPVPLVERTVWEPLRLSERQATFALLEEGRPKQWDKRFTGGTPIDLKVPRLCADSGDIKLGKTKIFIKHPHMLFDLEDQRAPGLFAVAVIIQSKARGFVCRWRYVRFLAVIGRVAAVARGFLARLRYRRILDGVALAQAVLRGRLQRVRYARLKVASKGRPLRYYAIRIQKAYRGYKGRCKVPRRTLKRTRVLGPRMLVASRRFRAATKIQTVWRMHVARKAFLARRRQVEVVQACWRRRVARQQFDKLREENYRVTLSHLLGGVTLVKHTVGSSLRMKKKRVVQFTYSDTGVLSWRGSGMRREQGVNVISDVVKMTKGLTSSRLKRTGETTKGEDVGVTGRLGGKYLVLHQKSGKTLDLECSDYTQRDSIKRTLSKVRGEW